MVHPSISPSPPPPSPAIGGVLLPYGPLLLHLGGTCQSTQGEPNLSAWCRVNSKWRDVEMSGDVPANVSGCAACILPGVDGGADRIYLSGGVDNNLSDEVSLSSFYEGELKNHGNVAAIRWTQITTAHAQPDKPVAAVAAPVEGDAPAPVAPKPVQGKVFWPSARARHVCAVSYPKGDVGNPRVLLIGGQTAVGSYPRDGVVSFSVNTRRFSEAKCSGKSPLPLSRSSLALLSGGDVAAVFGGKGPSGVSGALSLLDLASLTWSALKVSPAPAPRCDALLVSCPAPLAVSEAAASAAAPAPAPTVEGEADGEEPAPVVHKASSTNKAAWPALGDGGEEGLLIFPGRGGEEADDSVVLVDRMGSASVVDVGGRGGKWGEVGVWSDGKVTVMGGAAAGGERFGTAEELDLFVPDEVVVGEEEGEVR
ncbi:hypothetical protein TeGR_g6681, partial [Tetraparma gracilis]